MSLIRGLGGLPKRRPDQLRQPPPTTTTPSTSDVVIAKTVIIFGDTGGLFVYTGTPRLGNPPIASITTASTDPYGNPVNPLANFGPEAGAHLGIDTRGNVYLANSSGVTTIYLSPGGELIGLYPSGAGSGPPSITLAAAAGTDQWGNTYTEGLTVTQGSFELDVNGIRVYDGTPAADMLIASISFTGLATYTDAYGNTVMPGTTSYQGDLATNQGFISGAVGYYLNSATGHQSGAWSQSALLFLGTDTHYGTGLWTFNNGQGPTISQFSTGFAVQDPVTSGQSETWHPVPLAGGWTAVDTPHYMMDNGGQGVRVFGSATHASFTATTALSTALPAAYRPGSPHNIAGSAVPPNTSSVYRASSEISTGGIISAVPNGQSCTEVDLCGYYPLY